MTCFVHGAEPLYFLDYIGCGPPRSGAHRVHRRGIANGCRQAQCALVGGETAELPDLYAPGEYDLAGFAVGVASRRRSSTAREWSLGDVILGLASSGLHSNGYSLARRIVFDVMKLAPTPSFREPAGPWSTNFSNRRVFT